MSQNLSRQQAQAIAEQAAGIFRASARAMNETEIQQASARLQRLRAAQTPDQVLRGLREIRGELAKLMAKSGVDIAGIRSCVSLINATTNPSDSGRQAGQPAQGPGSTLPEPPSRVFPQGRGPGSTLPDPASGRFRQLRPHGVRREGMSTDPYDEVLPIPRQQAAADPRQTDNLWEGSPPSSQHITGQAGPGQTRQDDSVRMSARPGMVSEGYGFEPLSASDVQAPHGLISSPQDSQVSRPRREEEDGEEEFGFAVLSQVPGAGKTQYLDATMDVDTLAVTMQGPQEDLSAAPEGYRRIRSVADQLLRSRSNLTQKDILYELENMGLFDDPLQTGQLRTLMQYLNDKGTFPQQDEWIIQQLHTGIRRMRKMDDQLDEASETQDSYFPERHQLLIRKHRLGYFGWNNAQELASKHQWQLESKIGEGGMGAVFRGVSIKPEMAGRVAAIKIVRQSGGRDPAIESRLGSQFNLEHRVVPVMDAGKLSDNRYLFIAMELLEGVEDLEQIPEEIGLEARMVAALGMATSLRTAHIGGAQKKGLLHKDIKPANYLVTGLRNGTVEDLLDSLNVYLSDLGLAREITDQDQPGARGTPLFMAPEQARGEQLTPAADVYALGISIYNVLTGTFPYPDGLNSVERILGYVSGLERSAIGLSDQHLAQLGVSFELVELLSRMTDPHPMNRPDMDEVVEVLERLVHSMRTDVRATAFWRMLAKIGIPAVVVLAMIIGGVMYSMRRPQAHVEFGASRRSVATELRNANDLESLRAALRRYEGLGAAPEGYEPEGEEPGDDTLTSLSTQVRAQVTAIETGNRLLAQGDALLTGNAPNFNGARAKFRAALAANGALSSVVRERLAGVDRAEVNQCSTNGLRLYRMGSIIDSGENFARIQQLSSRGLSSRGRDGILERMRIITNWDSHRIQLEVQIKEIHLISTQVLNIVEGLEIEARSGNRDAFTKLIMLRSRYTHLLSGRVDLAESREQVRADLSRLDNQQMLFIQELILRITRFVISLPCEGNYSDGNPVFNPGDLQTSQESTFALATGYRERLDREIQARRITSGALLELLEMLHFLETSFVRYGRLTSENSTDTDRQDSYEAFIRDVVNTTVRRAWAFLNETQIDQTINECRRRFSEDSILFRLVRELPR